MIRTHTIRERRVDALLRAAVRADVIAEMQAYDSLPQELRALISQRSASTNCASIAEAIKDGEFTADDMIRLLRAEALS